MTQEERIAQLEQENAELRAQLAEAYQQINQLAERLQRMAGIYTSTYNKIKHRHLITTDIVAYKSTGADQIEYVKLMKSADELTTNTISAINTMATIADTLLFLDKTGQLV